ncbi:hypothetical protein K4K58_000459 [Colletotrichum sp. SAR11_239]|nr:hypothetical protein K4K58_000459 [Colletotrichum sp. SAR11_239]
MDHHLELIFEILGGLAVAFIILVTLTIVWSEVVEVLVANPHQFIRHGRRLQTLLRLPRWLCVFSDTDPGMPDDHIYVIGTAALPWGAILVIITSWTLYLVTQRQVPSKWFWFSVLVFVLSVGCSWNKHCGDPKFVALGSSISAPNYSSTQNYIDLNEQQTDSIPIHFPPTMSDLTSLEYLGILMKGAFIFITTLLICAELIDTFTETSCPSIPCRQRAQNLHRLLASLRVFPDSNPGIGQRALRFIANAALPQGIALLALSARATYLAARHEVPSRWFCYLLGILTGGWSRANGVYIMM